VHAHSVHALAAKSGQQRGVHVQHSAREGTAEFRRHETQVASEEHELHATRAELCHELRRRETRLRRVPRGGVAQHRQSLGASIVERAARLLVAHHHRHASPDTTVQRRGMQRFKV